LDCPLERTVRPMLPKEPEPHKPATTPARKLHKNPRPDAIPVTR